MATNNMMSVNEFADSIKAKYPSYSSMDNTDLAKKMVAKYPIYASKVAFNTTSTNLKVGGPINWSTSKLPGAITGQAIGTAWAKNMPKWLGGAGKDSKYVSGGPTGEQVVGDIARSGAIVASVAAAPETLLGSTATFAGIGAVEAGGQAMTENADTKAVAKRAFMGALVGGATGAVGYGIQKGVQAAIDKSPTSIMNNVLKISAKVKAAGKSPSNFLVDEGVWGSLGGMQKSVQEGMSTENAAINQATFGAKGGLVYEEVEDAAIKSLSEGKLGDLYSPEEIRGLVQGVPVSRLRDAKGLVGWTDVNGVRQSLGALIGDNKWLQGNPSENTQAAEAVYGALSDAIKKATGTTEEFSRLSNWLEANKAIGNTLDAADSKWGIGLLDGVAATAGSVVGAFAGNPVAGAAMGFAAEKLARSPAVLTGASQLIANAPSVGGALGRAATTLGASNAVGR